MIPPYTAILRKYFFKKTSQSLSFSSSACSSEVYRVSFSLALSGSTLSSNPTKIGAALMQNGVVNVVITETATTIGYMYSSIIPRLIPNEAIIKANSPICASANPLDTAFGRLCPERSIPMLLNTSFPTSVTRIITTIGMMYFAIISGCTIIPTEIKKTAPKRSFTPLVNVSTRSTCTVPARSEPARKAPSAVENPRLSASRTMPKQIPMDTTRSISSFISFMVLLKNVGSR